MLHATALYENRGDCDEASIMYNLPNGAKEIYNLIKIHSINGLSSCHQDCYGYL